MANEEQSVGPPPGSAVSDELQTELELVYLRAGAYPVCETAPVELENGDFFRVLREDGLEHLREEFARENSPEYRVRPLWSLVPVNLSVWMPSHEPQIRLRYREVESSEVPCE